jgi:hypothetical protein
MNFTVTLRAVCYGRSDEADVSLILLVCDAQSRFLEIPVSFERQIPQIKEVLGWPELVDVVIAKARAEVERLGVPKVSEGQPVQGRPSPTLTLQCQLDYDALDKLLTAIGGIHSTDFFPVEAAAVI